MTIRWKHPRYECWGNGNEECHGKLSIVSFQREGFTDSGIQGKLRCLECGRDYVVHSASCEEAMGPENPPLPVWGTKLADAGDEGLPIQRDQEQTAALDAVIQEQYEEHNATERSSFLERAAEMTAVRIPMEAERAEALEARLSGLAEKLGLPTERSSDVEEHGVPLEAVAVQAAAVRREQNARYTNGKLWLPPPFRYAGGKRKSLPSLVPLALRWREAKFAGPDPSRTYYEPFVGGGALFWALAGMDRDLPGWPWDANKAPEDFDEEGEPLHAWAVIADLNPDLIRCYRGLRDDVESVIRFLEDAKENHAADPEAYFQAVRTMHVPRNEPGENYDPLGAARFLYLVGVGFNGMWRTNDDGKHNVPLGRKGKGDDKVPLQVPLDPDHLRTCAKALRGVRIVQADFRETLKLARTGDLVYCDPPYAAVSETADFGERAGSYGSNAAFDWEEQNALCIALRRMADAGVSIIASNADTPKLREWYTEKRPGHSMAHVPFSVTTLQVPRAINSDPTKRGKVSELLITANIPGLAPTFVDRPEDSATASSGATMHAPEVPPSEPAPTSRRKKDAAVPAEPRPYITQVTSNLKSGDGQPWTVQLDRHTLFQGPRGSGKSRVQQAIQWFHTGRLEDVAQRDPKSVAELRSLGFDPDREGPAFHVTVTYSDGRVLTRILGDDKAAVDRPEYLPVTVVLEALRAGPDKARAFFLAQLEAGITDKDVTNQIGQANQQRYEAEAVGSRVRTPVGMLLHVIESCRFQAKTIQQEAKNAELLLQNAPVMPPSESRAQDLEQQLASVEQELRAWHYGRVKSALADVRAWESFMAQFPAEADMAPQVDPAAAVRELEYQRRLAAFQEVIETCVLKALQSCPVCESSGPLDETHWKHQHAKFTGLLEQAKAEAYVPVTIAEPTIVVPLASGPQEMTRGQVRANLNMAAAALRDATRGMDVVPSDAELAAMPAPTRRYEDLTALRTKFGMDISAERQALGRWSDVLRAREVIASAEQRKAVWTSLQGLCEAARDTLLRMQVDKLTERVNRYLPKSIGSFALLLSDGTRETLRVGLYRKRGIAVMLHTALSGAEEAAVLLALSAALAESSNDVAVLIPRERAFDPKALRETMRALSKSDCQIILTSTVAPAGRGSKDWSVVETVPLWDVAVAEEHEEGAGVGTQNGEPVVATGPAGEAK